MAVVFMKALLFGNFAVQILGESCQEGSPALCSKPRAGSAMLQSQTNTKLDAAIHEGKKEVSAFKTMLSAQPLVGKVASLEAEDAKLSKQVADLRKQVGITESGSGTETIEAEAASMLQQASAPTALYSSQAAQGATSYATAPSRSLSPHHRDHAATSYGPKKSPATGLIDTTMAVQQTPDAETADAEADVEVVEDKGGPLKSRVATLEASTATLESHVNTLENEVLGRAAAFLLQSKRGVQVTVSQRSAHSLKERVNVLEDKVDSLQTRVGSLQHEVFGGSK